MAAAKRVDAPERWEVQGQPLRDDDLRDRLSACLAEAGELLGPGDTVADAAELADFSAAEEALERALEGLEERLDEPTAGASDARAILETIRHLLDAREWLRTTRMVSRQRAFVDVQAALGRLRGIETIERMVEAIPQEICACGFDRAMLSRVHDSWWIPETFHVQGDPEWAAQIIAVGRDQRTRLDHLVLESEMVRRRGPMIVRDAQSDPRIQAVLGTVTDTRSYVAAPLMPEGRVIGFVHADCHLQRRYVDEFDRDVLWMLAEGIGYAFERTVLLERLGSLRGSVRDLTESIGTTIDKVCSAQVDFARIDLRSAEASRSTVEGVVAEPESRLQMLLTRRELEIVRLMAAGETNAAIAEQLVISHATVKTHVKHVLRKLRAANRTEAVSRFVRLTKGE